MQEIKMWTNGLEVEHDAMAQLRNIASLGSSQKTEKIVR